MVYVLSKTGQPLMPTENHAKVRILLKQGKAKVVHRCPFTIQLLYSSTNYTQKVTLGVDSGSKHIGLSATTKDIESRKTGGNAPNNLITLCETCHTGYHKGTVKLPKTIHRGMSFKDATFMGVMRWALYEKLKVIYSDVQLTYGYITKNTRIKNGLPKDHYIDARCISGNPNAVSNGDVYYYKKVRCHNRQIHKNTILKGGYRKRNQAAYEVKGFRLYDQVLWKGQKCFIFGRRATGRMDLRLLDGTHVNASVRYKNLKLLKMRNSYLVEQRKVG